MANPDEILNSEQVAELLDTSVNYLYQMRVKNSGPISRRVRGRLQYRRVDVELWAARRLIDSIRGETL